EAQILCSLRLWRSRLLLITIGGDEGLTMELETTARIGHDGILTLSIPTSIAEADSEVFVTVRPISSKTTKVRTMDRNEWVAFLARTGGSITDPTFEWQPRGKFETRDP